MNGFTGSGAAATDLFLEVLLMREDRPVTDDIRTTLIFLGLSDGVAIAKAFLFHFVYVLFCLLTILLFVTGVELKFKLSYCTDNSW